MTPPLDLADLRAKCLAATKGPWHHEQDDEKSYVSMGRGLPPLHEMPANDAAYIAAASPDAILGLLNRLEELERVCQKWQDHFTDTPGVAAANAEIVSLRQQLAAVTKERDAQRLCADSYYEDIGKRAAENDALTQQLAASQADSERHARGAEEYRAEIDAIKAVLGLTGGGIDLPLSEHISSALRQAAELRAALEKTCKFAETMIDELAQHEDDPGMMWGHRNLLAKLRAIGGKAGV